jgi:nicotinamidase-related amidase
MLRTINTCLYLKGEKVMKVLVVVDMQNDFITGSLGTPEAQAIVPNVKKKIEHAKENGYYIIYTRDTHKDYYLSTREGRKLPVEHCIKGTRGWEIADGLVVDDALIINKKTFGSKDLVWKLTDMTAYEIIEEVELVGLCTDICVVSNALMLKAALYETCEVSVDASCCAGVTPQSHEAALKTMEMCQINVKRG